MTNIKLSNAQQTALVAFTARYAGVGVEIASKTLDALIEKKLVAFVAAKLETAVYDREGGTKASLVITNAGLAVRATIDTTQDTASYGEDPSATKKMAGVMVKSYHDIYMAQGGGNADNVDVTLREVFMTKSREVQTKKGIRAEPALDVDALKAWGVEIGLWNDRWDALNPGMRRMNLANRVRGAIRNGKEIELKGKKLVIG